MSVGKRLARDPEWAPAADATMPGTPGRPGTPGAATHTSSAYALADKLADGARLMIQHVSLVLDMPTDVDGYGPRPRAVVQLYNIESVAANEHWQEGDLERMRQFSASRPTLFTFRKVRACVCVCVCACVCVCVCACASSRERCTKGVRNSPPWDLRGACCPVESHNRTSCVVRVCAWMQLVRPVACARVSDRAPQRAVGDGGWAGGGGGCGGGRCCGTR